LAAEPLVVLAEAEAAAEPAAAEVPVEVEVAVLQEEVPLVMLKVSD